jgi:hypothetical protein
MHFVVPCDSLPLFEAVREHVEAHCPCPAGWRLSFERCAENDRVAAYQRALGAGGIDALVLLQKNARPSHPQFVEKLAAALQQADCVSLGGARRWSRLEWRTDAFEEKAGAFITPSSEKDTLVELHLVGPGEEELVGGMAILDGLLVAVRPDAGPWPTFDEALAGADALLEEVWTHAAGRQGRRLAVHRNLGVFVGADVQLDCGNRTEARLHCNALQGFDPFALDALKDDSSSLSAPLADLAAALGVADAYFGPAG